MKSEFSKDSSEQQSTFLNWINSLFARLGEAKGAVKHLKTSASPYWWPLMEDCVSKEERNVMAEFIRSSPRLTYGEEIKKFEKAWAEWNGSPYALYVNSGTSANYLILAVCKELYDWTSDTEILVPAVTWGTTVSSVMNLGLIPVPVDLDPVTMSMSIEDASRKITPNTKAIFLTHCLGIPNDLDKLQELATQKNLTLLEDCCESHGAKWKGKKVGNFSLASSYSFFWGHHMTTIEGGMVCCTSPQFIDIAKSMRNHGLTRDMEIRELVENDFPDIDPRFLFLTPGFNFRGTETYARLGQMQLKNLDSTIEQRNRNYEEFVAISNKYSHLFRTFHPPKGGEMSSYCLALLFKSREVKDTVVKLLEADGVETRPIITGNLLRQPFIKKFYEKRSRSLGTCPVADEIHEFGIYIGNNQFINSSALVRLDSLLASCSQDNQLCL